jgi:hypothetical protein
MTTNNQKCTNCEKTGLPILPVRYSVLPQKVKATIPSGISGARVTEVALEAHHYGLRTLREGWVYLFYEIGPRGSRYWEAYKVTSDGRLWKQALPLPRTPITDPACAQRAIAVPMDLIAIERPEKCTGRVFIAFSEHAWHNEVFDRYAADATLMQARMQFIKPAEWIASGTDASGHAIVATEQAIDGVIEYMPGFDPKLLATPNDKQLLSDKTGDYNEDLLKHEATRYPMYIRQASPASASQALVKLMKQIGIKGQTAGSGSSSHPPMMIALWDGIGNVHELNGFRGDPVSWLDQYVTKERTLQVGALQAIDAAHKIVESQTVPELQSEESRAKIIYSTTPMGRPDAQRTLPIGRAQALASATPARVPHVNAYYDDMTWMASNNTPELYQRKLLNYGQLTTAGTPKFDVPYIGARRDQIMNEARAEARTQSGAHERNLAAMTSYNWSKYETRLKRKDIENFRTKFKTLQSAVFDLQESRSADVGKWLEAKLFLNTLEDYESSDLLDAMVFEVVITEALAGIGSTPKGKTILDALVTKWDPLQPASLIWRVFAMNQKDARQELRELLKIALAKKEMSLEAAPEQANIGQSSGVNAVISASAKVSKLNGYYKNFAKLALEKDPAKISPLGALFKRLEVDRFGMTVGDAIFAKFQINRLGDFVGEKIIQTVLLQRAGISNYDAILLLRKQADLEKWSRQEKIALLSNAVSVARIGTPKTMLKSTEALYDVWHEMKSTKDGTKALRSGRIAVVAALLEAVNFYKLITAAPDEDTRTKLEQSGASMLSSLITITMTPYYGVLKNSARSQTWKLVGSGLSSFGTFISAWIDGGKMSTTFNKQQFDISLIYFSKAGIGMAAGVSTLIDAISTAAPLLKDLAKQYGMEVVIEAIKIASKRAIAVFILRLAVMLTGWELTIGLLFLQGMAEFLTPNELESWCSRCAFGTAQEKIFGLMDHHVERYIDPPQQEKEFVNAMSSLS